MDAGGFPLADPFRRFVLIDSRSVEPDPDGIAAARIRGKRSAIVATGNGHALPSRFLLTGAQRPFAWFAEPKVPR